ncbi:MAG: DUF2235 domain-containing protein [Pseudomonadota bacterium]
MAKNLLICFDGTWNTAQSEGEHEDNEATNVWRLFKLAQGDVYEEGKGSSANYAASQIKWYDEGVGTAWYERLRGGLFGHGLDENILQGYMALAELYEEGDKIFLCGFSRGAYTARSLGGLIYRCGLVDRHKLEEMGESLQKNSLTDLGKACEKALTLYHDYDNEEDEKEKESTHAVASFRKLYSRTVPIECIAVWDTVKALGLPSAVVDWLPFGLGERYNAARYGFHDDTLSPIVRHGYHALAIDEHRADFASVLWDDNNNECTHVVQNECTYVMQNECNQVITIDNLSVSDTPLNDKKPKTSQIIEQRWFCGAHSDVGGGYESRALSDQSLIWMCHKLDECGLSLQDAIWAREVHSSAFPCSHVPYSPLCFAPITDSFRDFYTITHPWQSRHLRAMHADNSTVTLDPTVLERIIYDASYRPQNEGLADLLEL